MIIKRALLAIGSLTLLLIISFCMVYSFFSVIASNMNIFSLIVTLILYCALLLTILFINSNYKVQFIKRQIIKLIEKQAEHEKEKLRYEKLSAEILKKFKSCIQEQNSNH